MRPDMRRPARRPGPRLYRPRRTADRRGSGTGRLWQGRLPRRWLRLGSIRVLLVAAISCAPAPEAELVPRSTLILGIDVSGSFQQGDRFDDALDFAAWYIHGHLNGAGGLEQPRALFVGAIGGELPGQPQAFRPIHDFEGKSPEQIEADLRDWFRPNDRFTDFSVFFDRAAELVKRQNLTLAPVTLVLLTDGIPDLGPGEKKSDDPAARYARIDLDPLEYLARNVTVRVLYPDPTVAVHWERDIPRNRVRMWTVDAVVMKGWREQLRDPEPAPAASAPRSAPAAMAAVDAEDPAAAHGGEQPADGAQPLQATVLPTPAAETPEDPADQPELWRWIRDNVDFRVRRSVL